MLRSSIADLLWRSVEVIRAGQSPSGAYVACPTFASYRYCWLRDGSFVADAMSRAGEVESAEAFFDWAARVALEREGRELAARYTLDGGDDESEWPHRQWDGWGLWLWAVAEHRGRHGAAADGRWDDAVDLVASFLERVWREPCTDWWEERVGLHAATLGCVAAGLRAAGRPADDVVAAVDTGLGERVDASLVALVTPLGLVAPERVLPAVERELVSPGGGVHRHRQDSFYGGGEWLLLTALLGWAYADAGRRDEARAALEWVAAHADAGGELPEQAHDHLLAPGEYEPWVEKWGPPPSPLLWSHAMFLDLALALDEP